MVDAAIGVDGLCAAAHSAGLAAVAVLLALEAKPAEGAGHRQRRAQRANVLAVGPFNEDRQAQDRGHKQAIRPGAVENSHQEGGLERLDLGQFLGQAHGEHRHRDEAKENDVFDPLQPVVPALRHLPLKALEADLARHLEDGLGQRTKRAHPAAKQPAPEQEHGDDDEDPEQEDERVGQEQRPGPLEQERMEPGQHLRDGRLRHGAKADEHNRQAPGGVLEGIDRPLVLVRGQAREFFTAGVNHRDGHQQDGKQHDLDRARLPDAHPGGVGLHHLGASAFEHGRGQPVGRVKAGEAACTGGAVHPVAQQAQFPRVGVGKRRRADDEDGRLVVARRTCGLHAIEVQVVQVAKRERVGALPDLHAVVQATAHKARALERLAPGGADDEDGVFVLLELLLQAGPAGSAEHVFANVGVAEVAEPQFNERLGTALLAELLGHDTQVLHGAACHQFVPGPGFACDLVARWLAHRGRQNADLLGHRRA